MRRKALLFSLLLGAAVLLSVVALRRETAQAEPAKDTFPSPPAKKPEIRDLQARKVEQILHTLHSRQGAEPGESHAIAEDELNSYLSYLLERENVTGVDALFVRLEEKSLTVYSIVDVDKIPKEGKDTATRLLMQTVLSGKQYLSAQGSLSAKNGMGEFMLTSARVNDMDIPLPLVNLLINSVTRKQNPPFDLAKPFRLPYGIREVEIQPSVLKIS
jgi:hypothetical protein